jgi:hypothetical protein
MAEILAIGAAAAYQITKIICETVNDVNTRGQRFKCTLKKKFKDPQGFEYEEEQTLEFQTEEAMKSYARDFRQSGIPIEFRTSSLPLANSH